MEPKSMTAALLEIMTLFKRYVYLKDKSSCLILGLYVLLTHCFKFFDAVPYLLITGPYGSGKTLILDLLQLLCYKPIKAEDISEASLYHFTNRVRGTLLLDEGEDLARKNPRKFNLSVVRSGYKKTGGVLRMYQGKFAWLRSYGPKVIANIGGIYNRPLTSRCIEIRTVEVEMEMERFSITLHGKSLRELSYGLASLFKRKTTQKKIESLHQNLKSIEGLHGRDFELWIGLLVVAQFIDSESPNLRLFERVTKIATTITEKRVKESAFNDWDSRLLLSVEKFFNLTGFTSDDFIQADKLTKHVVDELRPSFNFRTESLRRKLDKESLVIDWKLIYFRENDGTQVHRMGWRVDIERLKRRVSKYGKFMQTIEEFDNEEKEKMMRDLDKGQWENLTDGERWKKLAQVGWPKNWKDPE